MEEKDYIKYMTSMFLHFNKCMEINLENMIKITEFLEEKGNVLYINEENNKVREYYHSYIKEKYSNEYICRSEYVSFGAERKCCGKWYKSSNYGKSWNGGYIFCEDCRNITFIDIEDDPGKEIRFKNFKPSGQMMICKKGYSYKTYPSFSSYRKHY